MIKILTLAVSLVSLILPSVNKENEQVAYTSNLVSEQAINNNKQVYETPTGDNTIYWVNGIDAPKMTSKESEFGQPGFFYKNHEKLPNYEAITYEFPYEKGHGYYDLNKNFDDRMDIEAFHCYLGAAANSLMWWMEQNKDYIDIYLSRLKQGLVYEQVDGLRKILPYDEVFWNEIRTEPEYTYPGSYGIRQVELGYSKLVRRALSKYYAKTDDGYSMDNVMDFFINGYQAIDPNVGFDELPPANSEDNFIKDNLGGLFHPIFGKTKLTNRYPGGNYEKLSNRLKTLIEDNQMVTLSYFSPAGAHALTVYGAEYDNKGMLKRVYVTDTDDTGNFVGKTKIVRGIHSMNVRNDNGTAVLANEVDENIKKGSYVIDVQTLDLGTEIWESVLNDTTGPNTPTISSISKDKTYAIGGNIDLEVKALKEKNSYLTYQWFKVNGNEEVALVGETKPTLHLDSSKEGVNEYFVRVGNVKNGKTVYKNSDKIKVTVADIPLINAETPRITFNNDFKTVNQYSSYTIKTSASVNDGGTLSYQWYQASDSQMSSSWKLSGETNSTFTVPTNNPGRYFYFCEVTNTNNSDNITGLNKVSARPKFSKRVDVKEYVLEDASLPIINTQPTSIEINQNEEAYLSVDASISDNGTLSYQWYKINSNNEEILLVNETSNKLKIDTSLPVENQYFVVIKNTNNNASINKEKTVKSNVVTVKVNEPYIPSNDSYLHSLKLNKGDINISFDKDIFNYEITVTNDVDQLELEYTKNDLAKVEITNPKLSVGENNVVIKVIAEDESISTYTIKVIKKDKEVIPSPDPEVPDVKPDVPEVKPNPDLPEIKPNPGLPDYVPEPEKTPNHTVRDALIITGSILVPLIFGIVLYFIMRKKK